MPKVVYKNYKSYDENGVIKIKRRVYSVGSDSRVIALPMKWCKEHGIEKGSELVLILQGNSLVITPNHEKEGN